MVGGAPLDVADLVGETEALAIDPALAGSTSLMVVRPIPDPHGGCHGRVQQAVRQSSGVCLPLLRPHCHSRLPQRPVTARAGGALRPQSRRRSRGQQGNLERAHSRLLSESWVEAYARNHHTPIEWAEKGVRKEDPARAALATPNGEQEPPTASISSSRAWSRGQASVSACRNIPPRTRIIASSVASVAASPTTTSTSAMRSSVRW